MEQAPLPAQTSRSVWLPRRDIPIVVFVFLVHLLLYSPALKPAFDTINPHDEAKYIDSGRSLLHLQVRGAAWAPLVAVVYAPLDLLLRRSPDWFLWEAFAGRLVLFGLLWASLFYLGTKFRHHTHPFVTAGILFLSVSFLPILQNQSDALYLACALLALAKVIQFRRSLFIRDLIVASVFLALGTLSRIESILLLGLLPVIAWAVARGQRPAAKVLAAAILPGLSILAVYLVVIRILGGSFDGGVQAKSWESFAMNQPVAAGEDPFQVTDRLYGSAEENDSSVLRAVLKNPAAFAQRIFANLRSLPDAYLEFFGKRLGIMMLLLMAWGAYALIRRKDPWDLVIMVLWAAPAAVSLAFLPRHFIPQSSHLPLVLAAVGVVFPIARDATRVEAAFFGLTAFGLAIYALLDNKLAFLPGAVLLLAVWGLVWLLRSRHLLAEDNLAVPLLLAFIAGLIVRGPFPFPDYPHIGTLPRERAVHYLEQNLPAGSRVISALPLPAIAARMEQVIPDEVRETSSAQSACRELRVLGVRAVYVDEVLRRTHPVLLDSLRQLIGKGLEIGITADPGSFQVLLVTSPCRASDL